MTDPSPTTDKTQATALIAGCRELSRLGLTHGTSGNISLRRDERRFFISPTGMTYDALEPDDIPLLDFDGRWFGRRCPSSEWRFHRDIFKSRAEVGAIVHTNSRSAHSQASNGRGIQVFHHMVTVARGSEIRCA